MALITPITRRNMLAASAAGTLYAVAGGPLLAANGAATGRKMVFVLLRGAADGLSMLAPVGDPDFAKTRGALAEEDGRHKLDSMFALHPKLTSIADRFAANEALLFHAVGLSNPSRSHFDAQNLLETGGPRPYSEKIGVLNRMLALPPGKVSALALSHEIPPSLAGPGAVASYDPAASAGFDEDYYSRIAGLLGRGDPSLGAMWERAVQTRTAGQEQDVSDQGLAQRLGTLASGFLKRPDGPDVVMIESTGWDTHSNQLGRLDRLTEQLSATLDALHAGLGEQWRSTLVTIVSEFGRTARTNGTAGSDHGTGSALYALGGNLPRSGIKADWPGLAPSQLFENRDLRTTLHTEAVLASLVAHHFVLDPALAIRTMYPGQNGLTQVSLT
ncbi:hypothetical protein GCM10011515_23460 [Tsuneonella deserti]|uniref:DUF1501 domain-containing protein n=1 Tax=Tsuneonella deserti TaxID=2035528 RepID=A0ABQ1SDB3_9SPHN|nr:DUF1501 domain-containing protein [Tsuneonella deserti]GGE03141.1 hypothetical protein GCM10011515_23460 [Tsuneonella deserti]